MTEPGQMSPETAWSVVDTAVQRLQLTRADHVLIAQAMEVLKKVIECQANLTK